MHIESLTIDSYKSFLQHVVIPLSPRFNVFIGPNNCGKTNILDAVDFLVNPHKDPSRLHHHRARVRMDMHATASEQKKFDIISSVSFLGEQSVVSARYAEGGDLPERTRAAISKRIKVLRYEDFSDFQQIEKDYTALAKKYPSVFKKFTLLLQDYFPEVNSIDRIVSDSSEHFGDVTVGSHSITIDRLGGGFQRILIILLYAVHPDYSVVLIDEPEIHLHPALIKKLLRFIMRNITNQIIATSHSPLFIDAYNLHQIYRVLKDEQGSHVYSLVQGKRSIDRQRLVQELNADNLEMFFADKVLLVEGVSDRILMRGLIDKFYKGNDEIKVLYTHGKSNIDIYVDLMEIFHIPYLVMLDRDALSMLASQYRDTGGTRRNKSVIEDLRRDHIIVLENGAIERNYPRRYQIKESKPLNALYASVNITPEEFASPAMKNLRNIIEQL